MTPENSQSEALFTFASQYLVAGVSGSARWNAALGRPVYLTHGDGCRLYDVDGTTYLDYNCSHGASFLGHNHPAIRKAIQQALDMGVICAYETEHHSRVAETLCRLIPCAEQVRFANSGSEATFTALRVARAALQEIEQPGFYGQIFATAAQLYGGLTALFARYGIPARVQGLGARFGIYFGLTHEVTAYQDAARIDGALAGRFIRECVARGVYFHNYGTMALGHHGFSAAHTSADIAETLTRVEDALKAMQTS